MALEQISQAVLETARTEADHLLKAAQKAASEKLDHARRAAEQEADRRYQAATRTIEENLARKLIQEQGVANKELLARKNAILQRIFAQAREEILDLPSGEYTAVMEKLLRRAAEGRGGVLRVHPSEYTVFEALLASFNAARPEVQHVRLDETQPLAERGGFIFISTEFQVDQTLATLLNDIEYKLAPHIAAGLFSGQK